MGILVFDIETIPDTGLGKRIHGLEGLSDDDIAKAMATKQIQKTGGSGFLPLHQHCVVAISVLYRQADNSVKLWSLGSETSDEKELVKRFFDGIERMTPTLVSWNGSGFDLPVLHYRSLAYGINASRYWERGAREHQFRYDNYLSRYHWRHIDLMDVLASHNLRSAAPLDEISIMLGLPGKMGMQGKRVWETYLEGDIKSIRRYCETDVLNTYLIYLRWELIAGELSAEGYERACADVQAMLTKSEQDHLQQYLKIWQENGSE